ncbi:MAG: sugar nucleotide-binding protein [Pirellulaceae bacterium]
MKLIPTRIDGLAICHTTTRTRPDGSSVVTRDLDRRIVHSFQQTIEADFGFTCELNYSKRAVSRILHAATGEIFVAVADIRVGSPTFGHWQGFYLRADDGRTLHVPAGVACGWQVTSEVGALDQSLSRRMYTEDWRWLRWNDLELAIAWPEVPEQIAVHARPSRSLHQLPDKALPRWVSSSLVKQSQITKLPTPRHQRVTPSGSGSQSKNSSRSLSTAGSPLPKKIVRPTTAYRDDLILVIGSNGSLGRDLCRHLSQLGTVIGGCREPERGSLLPLPIHVDVSRPASIRQAIRKLKPTLIVNAAGLSDVELAEREPRLAQLINATAPAIMADEAKLIGASLVHFCSDLVFSGQGDRPWKESDTPEPVNQCGRTKLLGTQAVQDSGVPHLILRSGWLYSDRGENYVTKLVDLLTYRNVIQLASDRFGTPTSTDWLAATTTNLLSGPRRISNRSTREWLHEHGGLYHVAPLGYASRLEVGDQIVATCRAHALPIVSSRLTGVPVQSLQGSATLPANCRLDCTKLALRFQLQLPRWQEEITAKVSHILSASKSHVCHVA